MFKILDLIIEQFSDYRPWPLYLLGFWSLGPKLFLAFPTPFFPKDTLLLLDEPFTFAIIYFRLNRLSMYSIGLP
jgi:hypothetical protein